jgi:hypothetical protein
MLVFYITSPGGAPAIDDARLSLGPREAEWVTMRSRETLEKTCRKQHKNTNSAFVGT